jgi:membrane-bound lytic murein transglycosylase F
MKKHYKGLFYNMTVNKYFKNAKQMKIAAGEARSDKAGQLSPYDDLVRKHARTYELDWRLITSQMYQESRFDPNVTSWVGAKGLMQVMPRTAQELKVDDVVKPDSGILAGTKLMARYSALFNSPEVKEKDRIRFALASYNCGPGHVYDARQLAKEMGLDPNKWFGNVEKAALLLSKREIARKVRYGYCRCEEPVKYVSQIQSRYDTYVKLVPLQ